MDIYFSIAFSFGRQGRDRLKIGPPEGAHPGGKGTETGKRLGSPEQGSSAYSGGEVVGPSPLSSASWGRKRPHPLRGPSPSAHGGDSRRKEHGQGVDRAKDAEDGWREGGMACARPRLPAPSNARSSRGRSARRPARR